MYIPKILINNSRWIEILVDLAKNSEDEDFFILLENQYFNELKMRRYAHQEIRLETAESFFEIEYSDSITSISKARFKELHSFLNSRLIGNNHFKTRLIEELKKFRLFNSIGEQKIFSCLLFGESGIGKTETARLLSKFLSPNEDLIKINFGNFSGQESISSLIGSPRGYVGSQEGGELSQKITFSNSKVILIDEFEKANASIRNFFLELLEDGRYTDSMGRVYDLNGYVIIFTTNVKQGEENNNFSPELLSRFNLIYRFLNLTLKEKETIAINYEKNLINKINNFQNQNDEDKFDYQYLSVYQKVDISVKNVRNIKEEIKLLISKQYYSLID